MPSTPSKKMVMRSPRLGRSWQEIRICARRAGLVSMGT